MLPPQREPAAPLNWPVVMFHEQGEKLAVADEYDQELRNFLKRVRERAARAAPAE